MRIDIYSDTVCPWCYLGKRRFELALAARPQYEPRVTWRPFELNPDLPAEGVERASYLAGRIGTPERVAEADAELKRQGEASGIEFRFDLIERVPNTRRSHLLMSHARLLRGGQRHRRHRGPGSTGSRSGSYGVRVPFGAHFACGPGRCDRRRA